MRFYRTIGLHGEKLPELPLPIPAVASKPTRMVSAGAKDFYLSNVVKSEIWANHASQPDGDSFGDSAVAANPGETLVDAGCVANMLEEQVHSAQVQPGMFSFSSFFCSSLYTARSC